MIEKILPTAVVNVVMDRESYSVMENAGERELGLLVCATVVESGFDFTIFLVPQDDTAQGMCCINYI